MERYYMISNLDLPEFMKKNLDDAYRQMATVKSEQQFRQLMLTAPSFVFSRTNDFMQALRADYIIILVKPDKIYEFEVLCHDPFRNRILIDSMKFKRVTIERYDQIVMDNYPIDATS